MKVNRILLAVLLAVMLVGNARAGQTAQAQGVGVESVTVTSPGTVSEGEASDYATLTWHNPWDMSDSLDIQQLNSPHYVYPNYFNLVAGCAAGLWCGQVRADAANPDLFLHPGYNDAMHVGRDGNVRPINANVYTQLTFRMWVDSVPAGTNGTFQVMWTTAPNTVAGFCDTANLKCGQSVFFQMYPGWNIYTIDLTQSKFNAGGGAAWSGSISGLRFDPGAGGMNGHVIYLDWARLTPKQNRAITWTQSGATGNATIDIRSQDGASVSTLRTYTRSAGQDWSTPQATAISAGSFTFQGSLPSGHWQFRVNAASGGLGDSGVVTVNAAPTLTFAKPSYTSGVDFGATAMGNPWSMDDTADLFVYYSNTNTQSSGTFSNGIFTAASAAGNPWGDPRLEFKDANLAIDTAKYRYATFKLKVNDDPTYHSPDISNGWIARLFWSNKVNTDHCGVTNDIPLHSAWNTVSVDLWANVLDTPVNPSCNTAWQGQAQRYRFRLDPLEVPAATTFYVDDVKLTAMDTVRRGTPFTIKYVLNKSVSTISFYYDTDTDPGAGRNPAVRYTPSSPPPLGSHPIFLPLTLKNYSSTDDVPGAVPYLWNTSGAAAGTYYLSADVNDGYATTTWYSDAQMVITP